MIFHVPGFMLGFGAENAETSGRKLWLGPRLYFREDTEGEPGGSEGCGTLGCELNDARTEIT